MKETVLLEICANSVGSAINAEAGGADRIELCANLECGGTTPSAASIKTCLDKMNIPINVLIRPRTGDFCYDKLEVETICSEIQLCRKWGVNGVVVGALLPDGGLDLEACAKFKEAAGELQFTFHRAFDLCTDPLLAIKQLIDLETDLVLTSGQRRTAIEGIELISALIQQAGNSLDIMPGSGINESNIESFVELGIRQIHLSAKTRIESSWLDQESPVDFSGTVPKNDYFQTNTSYVQKIKKLINP